MEFEGIAELAKGIAQGSTSARAVVEGYVRRVESLDRSACGSSSDSAAAVAAGFCAGAVGGEFQADLDAYLSTRGPDRPVKSMEVPVRLNAERATKARRDPPFASRAET
jgi:Asp-tRNA(Asn)/Glu-tRNA(Gln) amidotransferase A subunit family amidase